MNLRNLFFSVITLSLTACGPVVNTTKTTSNDLSSYKTFAYLPNSNFEDLDKGYGNNNIGTTVIESVNTNMQQLGYTLDRTNPDLLVLLSTSTDLDTNVTKEPVYATYPNYYGRSYGVSPYYQNYYYNGYSGYNQLIGYDTDVNTYKEGTLRLSLVDSETKNIVWKGTASNSIYKSQNESKAIAKFVDDMFAKYPKNR
jgi:hypothetical protein